MRLRERLLRVEMIPTVLFAAVLVLALVFLDEIRGWFSVGKTAPTSAPKASAPPPSSAAAIAAYDFSDAALQALDGALDGYEQARALLAADSMEGLTEHGRAAAEWIRRAGSETKKAPEPIARMLLDGGAAAERLAAAKDLKSARRAFADLSRALITLATADARLQKGRFVFECPMAKKEGYGKWLQKSDKLENPYMGPKMLTCGGASSFEAAASQDSGAIVSHEGHGHQGSDIAYHTCSMHPSVKQSEPGQCPICGMELVPVTFDEEEGGVIFVDEGRRQLIGVRIGEVTRGPMKKTLRTIGKLTYDETKLVDVTLKYDGWIHKLHADSVGVRVKRGGPLFSVYSPEIYAAQGDLLTALNGPRLDKKSEDPLVAIAKERLSLLDAHGLDKHLRKTGKPLKYITIASPAAGYVVEKKVFDGSSFKAGERLMRIAGLDKVWLEAELYEHELPLVKVGDVATVTLSYVPGKRFRGEVTYVYPYLDPKSRTGEARLELDNPELALKPDMYANVELAVDLGERLRVPETAVIFTGRRRLVFVDLGKGRMRPQEVELGARAGEHYEVLAGLRAGQRVVISGNFLVAAESRIRSAAKYWYAEKEDEKKVEESEVEDNKVGGKPPPETQPKQRKPEKTIYTCPMHPEVQSATPGKCPKCGMPLEPKR